MRGRVAVALAVALVAAPSLAQAGKPRADQAQIVVTRETHSRPMHSESQTFVFYDERGCAKPFYNFFMMWPLPGTKKVVVAGAKPMVIIANLSIIEDTPAGYNQLRMDSWTCMVSAGFTPQAGHVYDVVQRNRSSRCWLEVRDHGTGTTPPDLVLAGGVDCLLPSDPAPPSAPETPAPPQSAPQP